jgi:hypothetical protein
VITAIGRVQIDEDLRIPDVDQMDRASGFRSFELYVVSVDIEALTICVLPYDRWPVLSGPISIAGSKVVVPIGIEDWYNDQDQTIEQRPEATTRQISQQHLRGFLALDFAAVDVGLEVYYRFTASTSFAGREGQRSGSDNVRYSTSFRADAQGAYPQVRRDAAERIQELEHVRVRRGFLKCGTLRPRGLSLEWRRQERTEENQVQPNTLTMFVQGDSNAR